MPIVIPETDNTFIVLPHRKRTNTEKTIENGITLAVKKEIRSDRKNKNSTRALMAAPTRADAHKFFIDAVSSSDKSKMTFNVKVPP